MTTDEAEHTVSDIPPAAYEADLRRKLKEVYKGGCGASLRRFVGCYVTTIIPVTATLVLCYLYRTVELYVLLAIVSGFTANALGILMHEGCHYFFHPDRRLNDLLADFLVCLPIFNTVVGYRIPHFEHHRDSGNKDDPYFELYSDYINRTDILRCILQDLSGLTAVKAFLTRYTTDKSTSVGQPGYALPGLLAVQSVLFVIYFACTGSLFGYFLAWVLPLMIVPAAVNRLRTVVEHAWPSQGRPINRSTVPAWWEYLLIAPYGYSYHFEHHLLMSIPYFELRKTHDSITSSAVQLSNDQLSPHGYFRTFLWLMRTLPRR